MKYSECRNIEFIKIKYYIHTYTENPIEQVIIDVGQKGVIRL